MKNLWQSITETWQVFGNFTCDSENIYVLVSASELKVITPGSVKSHTLDVEIVSLLDMTFLSLDDKLFFVTTSSLVSYSPLTKECLIEGEMTCQILSAKWAPNQEVLALLLANGSVVLQNSELEIIKMHELGPLTDGFIAWRSDSKFFQISAQNQGFKISTFNRLGEFLQSPIVSDVNGPVKCVCDSLNIIDNKIFSWNHALIAGIKGKNIVLWEKNGLVHDEICRHGEDVLQIEWSPDGKILAIVSAAGLELYIRSNYHWYFKNFVKSVTRIGWTEDFLVICGSDSLKRLRFDSVYDRNNDKIVVVDAHTLNVTEFSKGILPPPMSHYQIKVKNIPKLVHVSETEIFVISDKVYKYPSEEVVFDSEADLVHVLDSKIYLVIGNKLLCNSEKAIELFHTYPLPIIKLFTDASTIYVELTDGAVYKEKSKIFSFPSYCSQVFTFPNSSFFVGLAGSTLYFNEKVLCTNCTSVLASEEFLFFTRKNAPYDVLYLFHVSNLPWNSVLPDPNPDHFFSRNIEKSSQIVCLSHNNLILQHSRGNLETISPRLLILHTIKSLILSKNYLQAFKLLRQHKIDLNLLCDINPNNFDIKIFYTQVQKQEYFNLFLTGLHDSDSVSKYFHTSPIDHAGKTNKISDQLREVMDPEMYPLSVLTAFAVKKPAEIENAVKWVQNLKKNAAPKPLRSPHEVPEPVTHQIYAEDVLKYLSWLVNPEKLYNVALSIYDLELAGDLAKYTQKDPKEYLPYLHNLSSLDPVLQKYSINMDLKNYSEALAVLVEGGQAYKEKALELVKSHNLLLEGLKLMQGNDLLRTCAEVLEKLGHPLQAAAIYEESCDFEYAKKMYLQSEEWEFAIKMAGVLGENINESLASRCAEMGRFEQAAGLLGTERDENLTIKYWVQAGKFKNAVLCARTSEGKGILKATLKNYAAEMVEDIRKNLRTWKEKRNRLTIVQQNKNLMPESEKVMNDEVASQYSADSSMSRATQFTKRQKKKAKKVRKASQKEGSQYEEDYLVDLLVTIRPDQAQFEKVESLCTGLILVGDIINANLLWSALEELKATTYVPVSTLKQQAFITKFYEAFPEIVKNEENESRLKDMYSGSMFLAEGLASHKLPTFSSKLQSFFKSINH